MMLCYSLCLLIPMSLSLTSFVFAQQIIGILMEINYSWLFPHLSLSRLSLRPPSAAILRLVIASFPFYFRIVVSFFFISVCPLHFNFCVFSLCLYFQINKNWDWTSYPSSDIRTKSLSSCSARTTHSNTVWTSEYDIRGKFQFSFPSDIEPSASASSRSQQILGIREILLINSLPPTENRYLWILWKFS